MSSSRTSNKRSEEVEQGVDSDMEFPPNENVEQRAAPDWSRYVSTNGGRVEVALWRTSVDVGNGKFFDTYNVTSRRSYFNKQEGKWKPVKGLRLDDLPALSLLMNAAHAWALTQLQTRTDE